MTNGFWHWWQHLPEKMSPILFELGPLKIHYYGLMYIMAFGVTYMVVSYRIKTEKEFDITNEMAQGVMSAMIIGLLIGARLGYVVFYNASYYLKHPLEIILPFSFSNGFTFTGISGMSYHGGLIGTIIAAAIYFKKHQLSFRKMADLFIPAIPLGYTFGRIGNFINGELYGRTTDGVFGMYFPGAPSNLLRHPSQLYEAFFEGIVLFIILWFIRKKLKYQGTTLAIYLAGYGIARFFIEFAREPDAHLGFIIFSLSMGQLLCISMIVLAIATYFYVRYLGKKT